jgi:putative aldouronate transport system substrate-binding protein
MMAKLGAAEGVMAGAGSAWSKEAFCFGQAVNFEYIPPLIGPDGQQMWRSDYAFSMFGNAGLIAASCEEPQAVMDFFDLCYDEWNSLQICYGSDGVGVSRDDQGNPILIKGPDGETGDAFRFTVSSEMGPGWASPEFEATVGGRGNSDTFLKRDASEFYSQWFVPESRYPIVKWTNEQAEQLSTLQTDINTYVDTALVDFVMNGGVEEGWQDYLDKLNRMGLSDLMAIYVQGYEDSMK